MVCGMGWRSDGRDKKEKDAFLAHPFLLVIRLGLEPKTPTLKVLCSTS